MPALNVAYHSSLIGQSNPSDPAPYKTTVTQLLRADTENGDTLSLHSVAYAVGRGFCDPSFLLLPPESANEYYHRINGRWNDGSSMGTGSLGNPSSGGVPTQFAFADTTDWLFCAQPYAECLYPTWTNSAVPVLVPNQQIHLQYALHAFSRSSLICDDFAHLWRQSNRVRSY